MLVAVDYFSKWPEAATCGTVTSSAVIKFLTAHFDRFGNVEEITTDNGSQFCSAEFEDFLDSLAIKHTRTALYAPQANAEVERFNRHMKEGVRVALVEGKEFTTAVRQVLATYRTTPNSTTGVTPAALMLRFPVRTPLTLLQQAAKPDITSMDVPIATRVHQISKQVITCVSSILYDHTSSRRRTRNHTRCCGQKEIPFGWTMAKHGTLDVVYVISRLLRHQSTPLQLHNQIGLLHPVNQLQTSKAQSLPSNYRHLHPVGNNNHSHH